LTGKERDWMGRLQGCSHLARYTWAASEPCEKSWLWSWSWAGSKQCSRKTVSVPITYRLSSHVLTFMHGRVIVAKAEQEAWLT